MVTCPAMNEKVTPEPLIPLQTRQERLSTLSRQYRENQPFPHIHLTNFLDEDVVRQVAAEFPKPTDTSWIQYKH